MRKKSIAIERQYGSGGRIVGRLVAEQLGIPCYDRELLTAAAKRYKLNPDVLRDNDERKTSLLYNMSLMGTELQDYGKFMQPYAIFQAECDTVRRLAEEGQAVFIGRCADHALREMDALKVFIYASDIRDRIARAGKADGVEPRGADIYIRRRDAQRRAYYHSMTKRDWGRMENYDMCLNTTALGYDGCAQAILSQLSSNNAT